VRDYSDASAAEQAPSGSASSNASPDSSVTISTQGLSKADQAFLNMADQLSSQVKYVIAAENQKLKRRHLPEESHQGAINQLDDAINSAARSLSQSDVPALTFSVGFSISAFSVAV
jgi:hypothetical protein